MDRADPDWHPHELIRPRRAITGMSAVLLPYASGGAVDWRAFEAHVVRTADAGLVPAVNMDTGWVHLLDRAAREEVVARAAAMLAGHPFVSGVFDDRDADTAQAAGATPIVFPSAATAEVVAAYEGFGKVCDRFLGFELSPVFNAEGRIWDLDTFAAVLAIDACVGAKHSSLHREPEWERLRLRDAVRPDFLVLTGNDLAIDMVMYGSDYLLGLSTFAPDLFARRDALWAAGDPGFYELNDALQDLGNLAFRPPVPAYRHSAAMFLHLRGWLDGVHIPAGAPTRPASDSALLQSTGERLGVL